MRNLTEYEQSCIKDATKLSKNFSENSERKEIKHLLEKDLDKNAFIKIRNFLDLMLHAQVTSALYGSDKLENLEYAQCTITAMKHLLRAKLDMNGQME